MKRTTYLIYVAIIVLFFPSVIYAQQVEKVNFQLPVNIPIYLSANYGELRPNHFHGGIDIKTQQVVGKPLFAIDSGSVVRVSSKPWGYGKAVYIKHTNGYMSVYGHINSFSPKIDSVVTAIQKSKKIHQFDETFKVGEIPLAKGEEFAKTGNSGSSGGPHLHLEIRDENGLATLNPFNFFPSIVDTKAPRLLNFYVYPLSANTAVQAKQGALVLTSKYISNGVYSLPYTIRAHGKIGFGIRANDYMQNTSNFYGLHSVELKCNGSLIYARKIDSVAFSETYDINGMIDYSTYLAKRQYVEKLFVEEHNTLSIYSVENYGIELDETNNLYACEVKGSDYHKNSFTLRFAVEYTQDTVTNAKMLADTIDCNTKFNYDLDSISFVVDSATFYKDYSFSVSTDTIKNGRYFSQEYTIHSSEKVARKPLLISIQSRLPDSLRLQGLVQIETYRGAKLGTLAKIDTSGKVSFITKTLGTYSVVIDTLRPAIKSFNFNNGDNLSNRSIISFKMSDNFSGISKYTAHIDGEWCILDFDGKKGTVYLNLRKTNLKKGSNHTLEIYVEDCVGNNRTVKRQFYK